VRLYREVDGLPFYKQIAHTILGGIVGACFVSLVGVMIGHPAGPVVQVAGSLAVGALALSYARSQGKPCELERGKVYEDRQGRVLYQEKASSGLLGLIGWNVGRPEVVFE
ncbi:MAG: hypothetical protein AB1758_36380, partial [Candidatus Eremiobacterota bacterium]